MLQIKAEISIEDFEAVTSALRRGRRDEAIELLDRWPRPPSDLPTIGFTATQRLTIWLKDEVRFHVENGRFQHALALVERYVTLPVPFNRADALALSYRKLHQ